MGAVFAVPSLLMGPDSILLDNSVMSEFAAILDWDEQTSSFSSSSVQILVPAVLSTVTTRPVPGVAIIVPLRPRPETVRGRCPCNDSFEVAISLWERVDIPPMHEAR